MSIESTGGRASTPVAWRGVGDGPDDADWWLDDRDDLDDPEDEVAARANVRARRHRRLAVLGVGGLLLATVVVTGTGGGTDDDSDTSPATPTTLGDVTVADAADDFEPARPDPMTPIEGGLRYGGAGGGADIRDGNRAVGPTSDDPLALSWTPPRLPTSVEPVWSRTIDLGAGPSQVGASEDVLDGVELGFGDDTLVVVAPAGPGQFVVSGLAPDGGDIRWSTTIPGDDARLIGAAEGIVGLEVRQATDITLLLLDEADGSTVAPTSEPVVRAQDVLIERLRGSRDVDVDALAGLEFVAATGAPQRVQEVASALDDGSATPLAADEVALGRLVLLIGNRLVGVRSSGDSFGESPLIVDWVRPGVLLLASPSERGATLLVSDGRGSQSVVDAATGRVVTEIDRLPSSVSVYTPTWNGVIVKRPALVGTALEAVDLDGVSRWQLLGSAPFAVGDGLIVTASIGADGLTITSRA